VKVDGTPYRTIWLATDGTTVQAIDQTLLPHRFVVRDLRTLEDAEVAIRTMIVRGAPLIGAAGAPLAPEAEAAQPLYARYWLHNRGPAPLGGLPAVAHLHPEALTAAPGDTVRLRLTVASDCSDASIHGAVRMRYPRGWASGSADSGARMWAPGRHIEGAFELPPRAYREAEVSVRVPDDAAPGAAGGARRGRPTSNLAAVRSDVLAGPLAARSRAPRRASRRSSGSRGRVPFAGRRRRTGPGRRPGSPDKRDLTTFL
jgi:hypothetical protein